MTERFDAKEFNEFGRRGEGEDGKGKFHRLFIAALTKVGDEKAGVIIGEAHKGRIEVSLTLNGVEVPVVAVCKEWDEQYERMLAEKAMELLKEKLGGLWGKLDGVNERVTDLLVEVERKVKRVIYETLAVEIPEEE